MIELDLSSQIADLRSTFSDITAVVDVPRLRAEIADLSEQAGVPDLWDDTTNAQKVTSALSHRQSELARITAIERRLDDLEVLVELANEAEDEESAAEARTELQSLQKALGDLEVQTLLERRVRRPVRDRHHPLRCRRRRRDRLRRDADAHVPALGGAAQVPGEGDGHLLRRGRGHQVRDLRGRRPPTRSARSRSRPAHTASRGSARSARRTSARRRFAAVEVIPLMEEATAVEVPEGDIRVDVFRSSGPGGQSVNTTDSAVRITHLPTGIVVSMQNEKSQIQNRAAAMRVLQTRLLLLQKEEEAAKKKELAGTITASWGDQMRSYFLYGQQLVKDLRTGYESGNPSSVFDGDLDGFIAAGIRWRAGSKNED